MTREEAKQIISDIDKAYRNYTADEYKALEMAIKALSQESCDDAISRDAVCNIVNDIRGCISVEGYWAILERLKKLPSVTQKSETVTEFADRCRECGAKYGKLLEQKSGKWIDRQFQSKIDGEIRNGWECSECGDRFFRYDLVNTDEFIPKYCPNCGARMFEPQERSGKE